jgi:cell wall-associated NlpC family hydrolase
MAALDPRLNAVRPDIADIALAGRVEAPRLAAGEPFRVVAPHAGLRQAPTPAARLATEALFGEGLAVFDITADGWCWAQLSEDRYVGWIRREAVAAAGAEPTHVVTAIRTIVFAEPDIKSPAVATLPRGALVAATDSAEDRNARYALVPGLGAVVEQHLGPRGEIAADFVAVAERFLGAPYLWGGKTNLGIDCSGLVQVALQAAGVAAPRDSDMQEAAVGAPLPLDPFPRLERGDLVFWRGHVGIMRDAGSLLHANAHYMQVAAEPLAHAVRRIGERNGPVTGVRRIAGRASAR